MIQLLQNDPGIIAAFAAAGASQVIVLSPEQRIPAAYPKLVVSGDLGVGTIYGDVLPQFFSGTIYVEAVARKTDNVSPAVNETPLATVRAIEKRVQLLVLGSVSQGVASLQGTTVSANYRIDSIGQRWSRLLPKEDPTIERWGASYHVIVDAYGLV